MDLMVAAYRFVDSTSIESRHCAFSGGRVVVLNKPVVQAFALQSQNGQQEQRNPSKRVPQPHLRASKDVCFSTHGHLRSEILLIGLCSTGSGELGALTENTTRRLH